ncbi:MULTISPECIES: DUF2188 domain-containing protein [Cupriavidus]|uniref:DUF2188 domain-containing protein n=1 Tax=Cupriavidus TaxID=106589 RepID=UPI0005A0C69C|nr:MULTISPECIES: DUF2188 domain-containing protein [Cupriavidus]QYY34150.1 DUF2188 domain-containing protein [Cupriavidus pinatubonensis]TPQ30827.1 DUF2188 domain-containing protein [Cupriavidus pinatubonensis]
MRKARIHVVRFEGLRWTTQIEGAPGASQSFPSREQAIAAGTERAKQERWELIIHRRDGGVYSRNDFGDQRGIIG